MAKINSETKLILGGLLAIALGTTALVSMEASRTDVQDLKLTFDAGTDAGATLNSSQVSLDVDVRAYNEAVIAARAADPELVDLLTGPVEPGAEVTTEVTILPGAEAHDLEPVGPADGMFEILEVTSEDVEGGVLVRVRARNNGPEPLRFSGVFHQVRSTPVTP